MQEVSFLLLYRIFPSSPHAMEKFGMSPKKKNDTEGKIRSQVPDRWAGAGLECRAGGRGRARPGRGWGTCVFLHKNVRKNRLECRLGAEYRGENPVFFAGYFPRFLGFFSRKKSGEFEGKIRCYHLLHSLRAKVTDKAWPLFFLE